MDSSSEEVQAPELEKWICDWMLWNQKHIRTSSWKSWTLMLDVLSFRMILRSEMFPASEWTFGQATSKMSEWNFLVEVWTRWLSESPHLQTASTEPLILSVTHGGSLKATRQSKVAATWWFIAVNYSGAAACGSLIMRSLWSQKKRIKRRRRSF